jgi:hypothetical protein
MIVRSLAAAAAGIVLCAAANPAAATTIFGTFSGTIYESGDDKNLFGAGIGAGTVVGLGVTGSFSYVFEDVPANPCGPGFACYQDIDGPDWLQINVTINGVILTIPAVSANVQELLNYDEAVTSYDYFQVYDDSQQSSLDSATNDQTGRANYLYVYFYDFINTFIPGEGVPTSGIWNIASIGDGLGAGAFNLEDYVYDWDTGIITYQDRSYAYWTLDRLSFGITQVPEPASFALFSAGLLGLGLMSRCRKRAAALV